MNFVEVNDADAVIAPHFDQVLIELGRRVDLRAVNYGKMNGQSLSAFGAASFDLCEKSF
jgi:hypothetical protein